MHRALLVIGWLNAALWFGGSLYFSLVAAPAVFQPAMKRVFNDYQVGVVAQLMLERYFIFQIICASVALAQFPIEWFRFRRAPQRGWMSLVTALFVIVAVGAFYVQPLLRSQFQRRYTAPTPELRLESRSQFRRWHAVSQMLNLAVLGGLAAHTWLAMRRMREWDEVPAPEATRTSR